MRVKRLTIAVLALAGTVLLGQGAWIHVKAQLGQALLFRAWSERQHTGQQVAPWPWADTWPVARLRSRRVKTDQLVLAHASGRNLAWGPTHVAPSALPGSMGHSIISGHRDTHFRFLAKLRVGDTLDLEYLTGQVSYEVIATEIIDLRVEPVLLEPEQAMLTLVTCYPFDAISANTPFRYLVHATRLTRTPASLATFNL
jgi:sortase A